MHPDVSISREKESESPLYFRFHSGFAPNFSGEGEVSAPKLKNILVRPQQASSSSSAPFIHNDDVVLAGGVHAVREHQAQQAQDPHPHAMPMQDDAPPQEAVPEAEVEEAEPPLHQPPPREPRVAAGERMDRRGKLTLSAVYKNGQQIGWGANCGVCQSLTIRSACKKQLPYGGKRSRELTDNECRLKLKKWLTMCVESPDREAHVGIDARSLALEDEAELDQTIRILRETL